MSAFLPALISSIRVPRMVPLGFGIVRQCVKFINCGAEIGCLITEGRWVFIGLPNSVKVRRLDVATGDYDEFVVDGPVDQVHAISVCNVVLFAGSQNGVIRAWRGSSRVMVFKWWQL